MLDAVAELGQNAIGNIERILGDEINADTFRAHELDHLLHLIDEPLGGVFEQQMCLIEEENEARLVDVSGFGKGFEDFGKKP